MYLPPNALTKSKQLPSEIYLLSSIGRNALPLVKSRLQLINLTRKVINCKTINISLNIIPPNQKQFQTPSRSVCKRRTPISEQEQVSTSLH